MWQLVLAIGIAIFVNIFTFYHSRNPNTMSIDLWRVWCLTKHWWGSGVPTINSKSISILLFKPTCFYIMELYVAVSKNIYRNSNALHSIFLNETYILTEPCYKHQMKWNSFFKSELRLFSKKQKAYLIGLTKLQLLHYLVISPPTLISGIPILNIRKNSPITY